MRKSEENEETISLHIKGELSFIGNPLSNFSGPIKEGLRLVLWGNSEKRATSCIFINDIDLIKKARVNTEIIILSSLSIDKKIMVGEIYSIGIPGVKLADFKIENIVGKWIKEIPRLAQD